MSQCKVDGCLNPVLAKELCNTHYLRLKRHGDTGFSTKGQGLRFIEKLLSSPQTEECVQWPFSRSNHGYGHVVVDGKLESVTRIICKRLFGPPPSSTHQAAHSCGKGHEGCCNPRHLRWATTKENYSDRYTHGTVPRGTLNQKAKLNECDVRNIRSEYAKGGITHKALANFFGITKQAIASIINRENWRHVA